MRRAAAAALLAAVLALPGAARAQEGWAGTWLVARDDPRIRTRAGAATLRIEVARDAAGAVALRWTADRGICEDPLDAPCEWVGARGMAAPVVVGTGVLVALLRVSADGDDPFLLVLERDAAGRVTGRLVSEKGGVAYRLDAVRE